MTDLLTTTYTTAPPEYDGFGTATVEVLDWLDAGKRFRRVETPTEHVVWQRTRYESGCYAAMDEGKFRAACAAGLFQQQPKE